MKNKTKQNKTKQNKKTVCSRIQFNGKQRDAGMLELKQTVLSLE